MRVHRDKLSKLRLEFKDAIRECVDDHGRKSRFRDHQCVEVPDCAKFNIGGADAFVEEAGKTWILDNHGNEYGYGALNTDQLAEIADAICERNKTR